jgi:hypothetical protein
MPEEAPVISAVPLDESVILDFLHSEAISSPGVNSYKWADTCLK